MKYTKSNLKELGKDFKGIGKSILNFGASTVSLIVDTAKIPVSLCKDARDKITSKKKTEVSNAEELIELKEETPKKSKVNSNAEPSQG